MTFRDFRAAIYRTIGAGLVVLALVMIFQHQPRAITGPVYCDKWAQYSGAATTAQVLVPAAGVGSSQTLICGYSVSGGASGTTTLGYGVSSITTTLALVNDIAGSQGNDGAAFWRGMVAPNGNNVYVQNSVASSGAIVLYWTQQ